MKACWFALYTKSRHEAVTYSELLRKGIEAYLP
ncbi:MAG: antitermination protein NusG, partial [Nitrospirae bacterium]